MQNSMALMNSSKNVDCIETYSYKWAMHFVDAANVCIGLPTITCHLEFSKAHLNS